MNMQELKIEYLPVDSLIEYDNNPRVNEGAVEYVAKSIQEFGFKNPIIIDRDNIIVAGHTRLKASKQLGMSKVPCIRVHDLTEEQINSFRLVDNKTAEFAEWDWGKLEEELSQITLDMGYFGFDESLEEIDISDVFVEAEQKEKQETVLEVECPHCGEVFQTDAHGKAI